MAVTFVASYGPAAFSSTSPQTASVTVSTGDVLVLIACRDRSSATAFTTPTGGGLTYTLQQAVLVNNNANNDMAMWTAVASSGQTFTLSWSNSSGLNWLINAFRYSGVNAVGTSAKASPASNGSTVSISPTVANAAIVLGQNDFNGNSTTPTANTTAGSFNRRANIVEASNATLYEGEYPNVGAAGSKTVGTTAPTTAWSLIAVELQPALAPPPGGLMVPRTAMFRAANY